MYPQSRTKVGMGSCDNNPNLKLHYGLVHFYKCLSVAFVTDADFHPSDSFGVTYLDLVYDTFAKEVCKKSTGAYLKQDTMLNLTFPIVEKFSIEDIVRIRVNEEVFSELRKILKNSTDATYSTVTSRESFVSEYNKYQKEMLDQWRSLIEASPSKSRLFVPSSLAIGSGMSFSTAVLTADTTIATIGAFPGFLSGVKNLIAAGTDPNKKLLKVLNKYSW